MTREEALEVIKSHPFLFASFPDDVIEALDVLIEQESVTDNKGENLETIISKVPPVTPQTRKGKWITYLSTAIEDFYQCSECGRMVHIKQTDSIKNYPYCHCGAKMAETEET